MKWLFRINCLGIDHFIPPALVLGGETNLAYSISHIFTGLHLILPPVDIAMNNRNHSFIKHLAGDVRVSAQVVWWSPGAVAQQKLIPQTVELQSSRGRALSGCSAAPSVEPDNKEIVKLKAFPATVS